ncbi:MAG: GNAT family N-acetyltransferase [Myxococcota bacterium]
MERMRTLRLLTLQDESILWEALYHALHVPPDAEPFDSGIVRHPMLSRYVEGWMQRSGDLGFLAESGSTPLGAAWLRRWSKGETGFGFVDLETPELTMAVWPGHRGHGIGSALLARLLEAASRDYAAVSLSVSRTNPAKRLYERFDFEIVGEPTDDSYIMRRSSSWRRAAGRSR